MTTLTIEIDDVTDLGQCEGAAGRLFENIKQHHGEAIAELIFTLYTERPNRRLLEEIMGAVGQTYGNLNLSEFIRQLEDENKTLPREQQWGARGAATHDTLRKQINRLLKKYKVLIDARFK